MGMDYYIIPDKEIECENEFPESLSFFFEQVGGYEEYAEVAQVSKILQIDLSLFQEISYDDDENYDTPIEADEEDESPGDSATIWHDTAAIILTIDNLLAKIAAFPDYHKQVLHNPTHRRDVDSLRQVTANENEAGLIQKLEALESNPLFAYPPDYGYLSEGRIVDDLKILRQTVTCYQDSGALKFKLLYM